MNAQGLPRPVEDFTAEDAENAESSISIRSANFLGVLCVPCGEGSVLRHPDLIDRISDWRLGGPGDSILC